MNNNFRNLVFEGGGVKGIAYGGALEILDGMGILKNIKRVAGTSAGAITAALFAVGYNYKEISDIISGTNFKNFEDGNMLIFNLIRIIRKYGWYKGDCFSDWMGDLIKAKTGKKDLTFGDLYEDIKTGKSIFKELSVVSSDLTLQKAIINSIKTPKIKIWEAVRCSMSIPLFFKAFIQNGNVIVDGGVTWNYPINIYDNIEYVENKENAETVEYNKDKGYVFNHETLGFRLDTRNEINYNNESWELPPVSIKNIFEHSKAIFSFLYETVNRSHIHNNDWNRTIFIETGEVKTTDFELSKDNIKMLIENGKNGVREYFGWRNNKEESN